MRLKLGMGGIQAKISVFTFLRFAPIGLVLDFQFILDARF